MKKDKNIPVDFEDNLTNYAPNLASINNENTFDVPKDYFDSLPERISAKCVNENYENSFIEKLKLIFNPKLYIPLSAGVSVVLIIIMFLYIQKIKISNEQSFAYPNTETTPELQYAQSLIDNGELDESTLMQTLIGVDDTSKTTRATTATENNIFELNKSNVVYNDTIHKVVITDDDIIQYLLDENNNDDIINN